jgi:polar amino acid transport system permease protein
MPDRGDQPIEPHSDGSEKGSPVDRVDTAAGAAEESPAAVLAGLRVAKTRHPGRWVATALVLLVVAVMAQTAAENPNFGWDRVAHYLFDPDILTGMGVTVWITLTAMAIGIVLGLLLAVVRLGSNPALKAAAAVYLWFFRGTPVLVQLIFWYNLAALFPRFELNIPFVQLQLFSVDVNSVITPLMAAFLGLGLNEGAYMSEIMRAGIMSIDKGQIEAAQAVGMRYRQVMRIVILPQAMRVVIPPTGNELIGMLKTTSLVSVIALADLLYSAQSIYSVNFQTIPLLITISAWYLVLTSALTVILGRLERHFRPDEHGSPEATSEEV